MSETQLHLFEIFLLNEAEIAGITGEISINTDWNNAQINVSFAGQEVDLAAAFCERANTITEQNLSTHIPEGDYAIGVSIPLTENDTAEALDNVTADFLAENLTPELRAQELQLRPICAENGQFPQLLTREIGHRRMGAGLDFNPIMQQQPV